MHSHLVLENLKATGHQVLENALGIIVFSNGFQFLMVISAVSGKNGLEPSGVAPNFNPISVMFPECLFFTNMDITHI